MRSLVAIGLFLLLPSVVAAVDPNEILSLTLVNSDVVVLGEFTTEPLRDPKRAQYRAEFKVARVLKWEAPKETQAGESIDVEIWRFESDDDERLPELKKGGKCVLFLNCEALKPRPLYCTADYWFGVQRPTQKMVKTLEEIVTGHQKFNPLRVPTEKEIDHIYLDRIWRGISNNFGDLKDPPLKLGEFRVRKEDVLEMLRDYRVVSKWKWTHEYCHTGLQDNTGTIVLNTNAKIQYMMRPGGLATLTFFDGRRLYLVHGECSR